MRREFYNYFKEVVLALVREKGGRVSRRWIFDETLIRRVRLYDLFAPFVAKCLNFFPSYIFPIIYTVLFNIDKTYLYLISIFYNRVNLLKNSPISKKSNFRLKSSVINKGSFEITSKDLIAELYNEKGVLQLQPILL